jgi:uncharacterized protein (TIGR02186 family)
MKSGRAERIWKTGRIWKICLVLMILCLNLPVHAFNSLVVDLSSHTVSITTGFSGTDVLLFGAIDGTQENSDVIVVMRGPDRAEIVRRKERQFGIWINTDSALIQNAPSFYQVAASRPLHHIGSERLFQDYRIGLESLNLKSDTSDSHFKDALIRIKQSAGLYSDFVQPVGFLDDRLFRTDMHIPSNVPMGVYRVDVYHIANGRVIEVKTTPLTVSKIGLGATIYDFAHQYAALYGLAAIALAAIAGWIAALAFKR